MALEALGDFPASDIRICAMILKEAQKPVCKTQGPCELPVEWGLILFDLHVLCTLARLRPQCESEE